MKKLLLVAFVLITACKHDAKYNAQGWMPAYKAGIKDGWMQSYPTPKNAADRALKEKICDCMISQLEKAFPHGLPEKTSKVTVVKIEASCMQKGRLYVR
jgi:hypothetical protein